MKEIWEVLNENIEIPDIVQEKADEAFALIQKEARESESGNKEWETKKVQDKKSIIAERDSMNTRKTTYGGKKRKWKFAAVGMAAAVAVGSLSVGAAAYLKWSKGMEDSLQVTEEQKEKAESSGLAAFPDMSVTDAGVTVTAQQSIIDNYYAYLSFKVEGYGVQPGQQPAFDYVEILVDGEELTSGHSFYNGLITGADGRAVMADGSEIPVDEDGSYLLDYTMEDGSLEYHINLASQQEAGWFDGKDIHVEFADLGVYANKYGDVAESIKGSWAFDWTLTSDDSSYEAELDAPLGDTGAVVKSVELSPISLNAVLEWPREEITEIGYHESQEEVDGEMVQKSEPFEYTYYQEPPRLTGVKLKDGTLLPYLYEGPGAEGYLSEDSELYSIRFAIDRILDLDEVQSLLFIKEYPEDEGALKEENLYVVDIR